LLPENFDELDGAQQSRARGVYHRRLVHYHYLKRTEECNKPHYDALTDPMCVLEDVHETMGLDGVQRKADNLLGLGPEGWVLTECYEKAVALCADEGETGGDYGALAQRSTCSESSSDGPLGVCCSYLMVEREVSFE
jgi:hypothetical protein